MNRIYISRTLLPFSIKRETRYIRLILLGIISLLYISKIFAQSNYLEGKVIDKNGSEIAFVNILLLDNDSLFIKGTTTDYNGIFKLESSSNAALIKMSYLGYKDLVLPIKGKINFETIQMEEESILLEELIVKGDRPVTRLKGDALVTTIENTFLSKIGSANDVLGQIPGVIQNDQDLEVLGRGKPLIYINGRQVREKSELEQLSANEIKNVELITNPGARYDATVKAVIRIRTARREGEGFGLNLRSSYYQSQNTDLIEQLDLNYRKRGDGSD